MCNVTKCDIATKKMFHECSDIARYYRPFLSRALNKTRHMKLNSILDTGAGKCLISGENKYKIYQGREVVVDR